MTLKRLLSSLVLAAAAGLPGSPAPAQVTHLSLTHAGAAVPLDVTGEMVAAGRAIAHGLLARTSRDVTRAVSDEEIAALGRRGTLLQVRLGRAEDVLLLRLRARTRASRVAAYVPPERDDQAFVFLGRGTWHRIVVVDLPEPVRREIRGLRARTAVGR